MFNSNKPQDTDNSAASQRLFDRIKSFITLVVANVRLTVTEKVTLLLSAIAIAAVVFAFISVAALFFSFAVAHLLANYLPLGWAYAIMCGVNILVAVVVVILRKPLIINPVAKFLCRLVLK